MIILACDHCKKQSPDAEGKNIADNWVNISLQRQYERQRDRERHRTFVLLCETCFPLLGSEVRVSL